MVQKQDRINPRNPSDLERKYNFKRSFGEVTQTAASAREVADRANQHTNEFDRRMDQQEVLKRLTNNGKAKGVYLDENGDIFFDASYIAAGVLSSQDESTFYLDLVNGILKGCFSELSVAGKTVEQIARTVINEEYGVGKLYLTFDPEDRPAAKYGGTWEQIEGRVLLGASEEYPAGAVGGEKEHTTTVDEMPEHHHEVMAQSGTDANGEWMFLDAKCTNTNGYRSLYMKNTGGNKPHNNMMPYIAVYIWRRIA